MLQRFKHALSSLCSQPTSAFTLCRKVLLNRGFGLPNKAAHERLIIGDIIQVLLSENRKEKELLHLYKSEQDDPTFFVGGGFYSKQEGKSWAVVKSCRTTGTNTIKQLPDYERASILKIEKALFCSMLDNCYQFIQIKTFLRK